MERATSWLANPSVLIRPATVELALNESHQPNPSSRWFQLTNSTKRKICGFFFNSSELKIFFTEKWTWDHNQSKFPSGSYLLAKRELTFSECSAVFSSNPCQVAQELVCVKRWCGRTTNESTFKAAEKTWNGWYLSRRRVGCTVVGDGTNICGLVQPHGLLGSMKLAKLGKCFCSVLFTSRSKQCTAALNRQPNCHWTSSVNSEFYLLCEADP